MDTAFDAGLIWIYDLWLKVADNVVVGGKVSIGLTATTIVSQWTWSATLLQSSTVASKVRDLIGLNDIFITII